MKILLEEHVPSDMEKFIISLIRIRANMDVENQLAYPSADRLARMREQYNDTLERMKFEG